MKTKYKEPFSQIYFDKDKYLETLLFKLSKIISGIWYSSTGTQKWKHNTQRWTMIEWRLIANSCSQLQLKVQFGQITHCHVMMQMVYLGSEHSKVQKWNHGEAKTCTKIPRMSSRSLWTTLKICQFLQFWCIKETAKAKLKASLQSDLIMKQEPSQKHIAAIIYNFSRGFWLNLMHINLWLFDFFWFFTSVCFTSIAMDPDSHSILTTSKITR